MTASRTLALLRHAKSDWHTESRDFDRPLNKRGRKDAPRIGAWLKRQGWVPELIYSSPAIRARETIESVIAAGGGEAGNLHWDDELYLASQDRLLQRIRTLPPDIERVMLVGHNPGLEELLEYLSRGPVPRTTSGKVLTTANLALLRLEGDWKDVDHHSAELLELVRPPDLD